ncbi:glycosyltransferase family 2 protein [Raineyella antarctica]|nr:glycosyltransferase family 2 protein [Raineyella antarctica]
MARNEEDIIGHSVRHMLDQGLDGVIVVDNMSTDTTPAILRGLAAQDARIHVGSDTQAAFHQGGKTSYLSHLAWRAGADWVVPFDADELWFAPGMTVKEFLVGLPSAQDMVWCDFRNVYPLPEDGRIALDSGNAVQVDRSESSWFRIAFRSRRWVWVGEGNHALRDHPGIPVRGLHMLHYSYRSLVQYSRKASQGVAALEAAGKGKDVAVHWRGWEELGENERESRWLGYLSGEEGSTDGAFVRGDRVVLADPSVWRRWDPNGELQVRV